MSEVHARRIRMDARAARFQRKTPGITVAYNLGMTEQPHPSQVVVAYDFTDSSKAALQRAFALANRAPFHVLHLICVVEPHGEVPGLPHRGKVDYPYAEQVQRALAETAANELKTASGSERVHLFVHARIGKPGDEILSLARDVGADLIIVGSRKTSGLEKLVLGSVSEKVVRDANCTVEVARPKTYEPVKLLDIYEVEPHHRYVAPHRYTYDARSVELRPMDWPLY